jgi:hypothetical protein
MKTRTKIEAGSERATRTPLVPIGILRCAALALTLFHANAHAATTFTHHFNLYGNWSQYLYSATNVEVYAERSAGSATFWRPTQLNVPGEVIYRFQLPNTISSATLSASIAVWTTGDAFPYDPGAYAYLDVGSDGSVWHNLDGRFANNGGGSSGPYNITPYVGDTQEVWVRARLMGTTSWPGDGPIFSQFLRTYPGARSDIFALDATMVPEPTPAVLLVGCSLLGLRRRRGRVSPL